MLKVVSTDVYKSEILGLDGYTLTLRWNNPLPRGHVFWRTGNFRDSLLEVGLNAESHTLEEITIVNIQRDWVFSEEIADFSNPRIPKQSGLPVLLWTKDKPSPRVVDKAGVFTIHIAEEHLSIRIGEIGEITKVLMAERALFGIDGDDNLAAIQLIKLQPEEVATIRATFPTFQGSANPKQVE